MDLGTQHHLLLTEQLRVFVLSCSATVPRMKADTAFPGLEKGLRIWETVCNGPKMNFHPACSAAPKSKHSNKQMNGKPSPPLPTPVLSQVWCCDGTCRTVCATVLPSSGVAFLSLSYVKPWSCDSDCERWCHVPTLSEGWMGSLGISVVEGGCTDLP